MIRLSIIVPAYNASSYLEQCIKSFETQSLPSDEYEIVVVDDGSCDKTYDIAKKLSIQYSNVKFLTQSNQGQSVARNNGIKHCQGEYIWCVDVDDYVNGEVKKIFDLLRGNSSLDVLAFQLCKMSEDGKILGRECTQPELVHGKIMKGRDAIIQGYNPSSVCALAIRKNFLLEHSLFFHVGITHQDVELSYRLFAEADDVLFVDIAPYLYILHPNSTSQSINPKKKIKYLSDDCIVIESFRTLANKYKNKDKALYKVILRRVKNIQFGMTWNLLLHRKEWKHKGIIEAVIKNMRQYNLFPLRGDFASWKKNLMARALNLFFHCY